MSTLEVDSIIDSAGTGAPSFPNGVRADVLTNAAGTGSPNFSLGLKTPNIAEVDTIAATAATGVIDYDVTTQSVLFYTTLASSACLLQKAGPAGSELRRRRPLRHSHGLTTLSQRSPCWCN